MKNIKILGTGCANCKNTYALVETVAREKGVEVTMEKVEDLPSIMGFGVMSMTDLVDRIAALAQDAPASARQP